MTTKYEQLLNHMNEYSSSYVNYWKDLEVIISRLEYEVANGLGVPNGNILIINGKPSSHRYVEVGIKGKVQSVSAIDAAIPKDMPKDRDSMSISFAMTVTIDMPEKSSSVGNYLDVKLKIEEGNYVFNFTPKDGDDFNILVGRGDSKVVSLQKVTDGVFEFIKTRYNLKSLN